MKFPKMVSPGAWGADDVEQEKLDSLEKKETGVQPNAGIYNNLYVIPHTLNELNIIFLQIIF